MRALASQGRRAASAELAQPRPNPVAASQNAPTRALPQTMQQASLQIGGASPSTMVAASDAVASPQFATVSGVSPTLGSLRLDAKPLQHIPPIRVHMPGQLSSTSGHSRLLPVSQHSVSSARWSTPGLQAHATRGRLLVNDVRRVESPVRTCSPPASSLEPPATARPVAYSAGVAWQARSSGNVQEAGGLSSDKIWDTASSPQRTRLQDVQVCHTIGPRCTRMPRA